MLAVNHIRRWWGVGILGERGRGEDEGEARRTIKTSTAMYVNLRSLPGASKPNINNGLVIFARAQQTPNITGTYVAPTVVIAILCPSHIQPTILPKDDNEL